MTTQSWGYFLPWTQWRQIAHRIYNADGSLAGDVAAFPWDQYSSVKDAATKAQFFIKDFDEAKIGASTLIEEREWRRGTGWFRWLGFIVPKKKRRSLDIHFDDEVGPEKGSWKGGLIGTSIEMLPGESHEQAFRRYCDEEHRSKYRKYRVTFADDRSREVADMTTYMPDERVLPDDYPVYGGYMYLADGKVYHSDWHGVTVAELKRRENFKEIRSCNWRRYNGTNQQIADLAPQ